MLSEVKLIVQNNLEVNVEEGSLTPKLATGHLQGRGHLFLTREDEFMINSFQVNIDTSDVNHTTYNKDSEVDLIQGKIEHTKENYEVSVTTLEREEKNLEPLASVLDSQNHKEWIEKTPDRITLHVNYKEDNFGIETKEIATTYDLNLIREDYSMLEYKDKLSEVRSSVSKYSYLRHLSKSNRLHFSHEKAELTLINNMTTSFRFFEQSVHNQKDFESI